MSTTRGDASESQHIGDAGMGKGNPFSAHTLLNVGLGTSGRGETGGGSGDKYKPELAQWHLDQARDVNIYESKAFG